MGQIEANFINVKRIELDSSFLERTVLLDLYQPFDSLNASSLQVLLINDGQDLLTMEFSTMLGGMVSGNEIPPVVCIGIHAGKERLQEYGVIGQPDYKGRGAMAARYRDFLLQELIPSIPEWTGCSLEKIRYSIAGFSLGGLSALDLGWKHPDLFNLVGVFSGALWWRDKDQHAPDFDESANLIMHRQVREGDCQPGLHFFFQAGTEDETADRNNNGIIDSIDDTLSLIQLLKAKGYQDHQIEYLEIEGGKHDTVTWASSLPSFLQWGWGIEKCPSN